MTPVNPPPAGACWDAATWDSPEAVAAPTASPAINRLLKTAWSSPPFTQTTRDRLVAEGVVVPAPDPDPVVATDPINQWSTQT